jgi:hypothetical protein
MKISTEEGKYLGEYPPIDVPILFKPELVPDKLLAHAGVFTPDMNEYYYTLSNASFSQFTVMYISKLGDRWSAPQEAFFNSSYLEHGVHFTEDGLWVYFSSTRPIGKEGRSSTWHIWRSKKVNNCWSEPEWVNIPGMDGNLTSHPSLTRAGHMYFHKANPNYTNFALYITKSEGGVFQEAKKVIFPDGENENTMTPFVSQDESYILYTKIVNGHEEIYISYREDGAWLAPQRLNNPINTNSLGNPYITPDERYMFYASGQVPSNASPSDWVIKWVSTQNIFMY